jgi:hypothetical protein
MASSRVRSLQCEASTAMPTAFMRATMPLPNAVRPPPFGSSIAVPRRFCPNVTRMQQRSPSSQK